MPARGAKGTALLAAAVNSALLLGKLFGGFLGKSSALLSDAVDSLTDLAGDVAVLGGIWLSERPPDDTHHFGHHKLESLAAAVVGFLVVGSAAAIVFRAMASLIRGAPEPAPWAVAVALGSAAVCLTTHAYLRKRAKALASTAIEAAAIHKLSDAATSLAAAAGIALSSFAKVPWGDAAASVLVALWVLRTGVGIVVRSCNELVDGAPPQSQRAALEEAVLKTPGVEELRSIKVRSAGGKLFVEAEIAVSPSLSVADGHVVAHRVQDRLTKGFPHVVAATVHVEPSEPQNRLPALEAVLRQIAAQDERILGFHNLDLLPTRSGSVAVVDIVVPPNMTVVAAHDVAEKVRYGLSALPGVADAIVHIDHRRD